MNKDTIVSKNEKNFILRSLESSLRIDGRPLTSFRALNLTFGKSFGEVLVQLGHTRVYAVVKCDIVAPYPDRPTEGFFNFNVNFSPMATPVFKGGKPDSYGVEIGRIIERGLRESRAIDTEALCIIAAEKVWDIRVDVHILDHCGNLIDAASIAAISALHHFRRPDITIGEQLIIHDPEDKEPVPLSIHHIPVCVTFAIFHNGNTIVIDPTWKEEKVMQGRLTITSNIHKEICAVQKSGGVPLTVEQILAATKLAQVKVSEITQAITDAINEDNSKRGLTINSTILTDTTSKSFFLNSGIGTEQEDDNMSFIDGSKTIEINEENIRSQVVPSFPDFNAQLEFETFASSLLAENVKSESSSSSSGSSMDDSEEEGETVITIN